MIPSNCCHDSSTCALTHSNIYYCTELPKVPPKKKSTKKPPPEPPVRDTDEAIAPPPSEVSFDADADAPPGMTSYTHGGIVYVYIMSIYV